MEAQTAFGGKQMQSNKQQRSMWWMALPAFLICAPLVAIAAVFMAFKLGFFLGGSLLASIIASGFSIFMYRDRKRGAHAANMGQTAASAAGSLAGIIAIIMQTIFWIGAADQVNWFNMGLFATASSMLGIGIGMMLTPVLVDRMQLTFPSGMAVYQILRSMMSLENFKKAAMWLLGGGIFGFGGNSSATLGAMYYDSGVFGAGIIVGARIAIPGFVLGLIGYFLVPTLLSLGWISEGQEFRHIGFYAGLAMGVGAAFVQIGHLLYQGWQKSQSMTEMPEEAKLPRWVTIWTIAWALITIAVGVLLMGAPLLILVAGVALSVLFVLVNGISTGVADANPVSGAFVLSCLALTVVLGVDSKLALLFAVAILLFTIAVGVDMQQDRSTGWRLGSNRTTQFFFQVPGVLMGVGLGLGLGYYFLMAYPELQDPNATSTVWSSAFTLKIVGGLQMVDGYKNEQIIMLVGGGFLGVIMQGFRMLLGKERLKKSFLLDTFLAPSPYAFAFGAFVPFLMTIWFAVGGLVGTFINWNQGAEAIESNGARSPVLGGGLIAGGAIAAFWVGLKMFMA